jgi:ADP-ribose pyrophosphatase YjhB (NUDIX family)
VGRIRTAAKAVIVEQGRILLNQCRDISGDWYALPGGGQEEEEALIETLVRECEEEIGTSVEVQRLLFVREIVVVNHTFTYLEEAAHQVELLFECRLPAGYQPHCGPGADAAQIDVKWMDAAAMENARVYPRRIRELVDPMRWTELPVYWGDLE